MKPPDLADRKELLRLAAIHAMTAVSREATDFLSRPPEEAVADVMVRSAPPLARTADGAG